jgi:hypothetical protein
MASFFVRQRRKTKIMHAGDIKLTGMHNVKKTILRRLCVWLCRYRGDPHVAAEFGGVEHRLSLCASCTACGVQRFYATPLPARSPADSFDKIADRDRGWLYKKISFERSPQADGKRQLLILTGRDADKSKRPKGTMKATIPRSFRTCGNRPADAVRLEHEAALAGDVYRSPRLRVF